MPERPTRNGSSPPKPAGEPAARQAALTPVQRRAVDRLLGTAPIVDRLGELFAEAGHSLHLVGGSVRDALLGQLGHDLDFTTSARPETIEDLLRPMTRTLWTVGREFGTIGGRIGDWQIEITTFRADAYAPESRKPIVRFGDTLEGDLIRRDFTVNAMALSLPDHRFVDPYGGVDDLVEHRLRTPSTPTVSFSDDPLRMLRAARFTAQLGLVPGPDLVKAITAERHRLEIVSAERIRDELSKLLLTERPRIGLDLLVRTGLADLFLPELPALRLERDEHHRHKDVYMHSLTVLEQAIDLEKVRNHEPDLVGRLAALLHDIGKPRTRKFEPGGKVTFHHHDVVGAKMVRKRMKTLRFAGDEIEAVAKLVELHLRFHGYSDSAENRAGWTDSAVRRYVRDAGDQLERLHILTRADCTTRNQAKATRLRRAYDELEWRIDELAKQEQLDSIRPDLDGNQIMEILGIPPGRQVGEAYKFLLELRIDNGPLGEDRAKQELLAWWAEQDH